MLKPELISEFTRQMSEKLNGGQGLPGEVELKRQVQLVAESAFSKLNLVTREEFDIQTEVLMRTRSKIDELEKQVQQMETQMAELLKARSDS
ncbi:accessory factor UbiK family protein [Oceanospirillum sediminis]|uniref:Ubiquinone biosynthesis accessory factor UbiK n=1 Tax=Oceanospirillum sediminis TaxID=2760088 RepID=A0A839ITW2_9GAMM|nr:accessory factor UbiK family protein [Oceanospirillum sediminis]MBB1488381.1 accessory factor UbiK family protein [Oceanospirillum sediminis]